MPEWIESLGYLGAFIGAVLEGEILLISAVQSARLGLLSLPYVLMAVTLGTLVSDWFYFLLGRSQGRRVLHRFEKQQKKLERMQHLLERRSTFLLLSYRFIYGFRIILPVLFGMSRISLQRFALFSLISTCLWIGLYGFMASRLAEFTALLFQG